MHYIAIKIFVLLRAGSSLRSKDVRGHTLSLNRAAHPGWGAGSDFSGVGQQSGLVLTCGVCEAGVPRELGPEGSWHVGG